MSTIKFTGIIKDKKWSSLLILMLLLQLVIATIIAIATSFLPDNQFIDVKNMGYPPLTHGFLLGSDDLGRSVVWQLLKGSQTTLLLSFLGVFFASIFGVVMGSISGYMGDDKVKINTDLFWSIGTFLILMVFFNPLQSFNNSYFYNWIVPISLALSAAFLIFIPLKKFRRTTLPLDLSLNRMVEIYITIPPIFVIILLTSIFRPSPVLFVIYCMLSLWPEFFLLSRAEVLKTKNALFIEAARAIGQRNRVIIFRHLLPNILSPLLVVFSFGFARLMVIEATLSYLGIGLPPEYPGWGKMILAFRNNTDYWWLLVFPGLLIFLNVIAVQQIGRKQEKETIPMELP